MGHEVLVEGCEALALGCEHHVVQLQDTNCVRGSAARPEAHAALGLGVRTTCSVGLRGVNCMGGPTMGHILGARPSCEARTACTTLAATSVHHQAVHIFYEILGAYEVGIMIRLRLHTRGIEI